jgi:hypothetical protein
LRAWALPVILLSISLAISTRPLHAHLRETLTDPYKLQRKRQHISFPVAIRHWSTKMPPKRTHTHDEAHTSLKDKLQNLQGSNARGGRRTGGPHVANGSNLKEVDNASTNSGQTSTDLSSSGNVRRALVLTILTSTSAVADT